MSWAILLSRDWFQSLIMYPLKKIVFLKEIEETDLEKKQIISFSFFV